MSMTKTEYKTKFLKKRSDKGKERWNISITRETRTKLIHLSYGGNGYKRIPLCDIIENILQDHFNANVATIKEIYQHDSPLY